HAHRAPRGEGQSPRGKGGGPPECGGRPQGEGELLVFTRGGRPSPAGGGAEEYRGSVLEISLLLDSNFSQLILVPLIRVEAESGRRDCGEGGGQHRAHGGAGG